MDVPDMQSERASTTRSSPAARTGATQSGSTPIFALGRQMQRDGREASPRRPISHEDPSDQNGPVRTNYGAEPGGNASTTQGGSFATPSLDLTKRSDFLAVDKQLAQYFKKASTMNWPLFLVLLSSTFCEQKRSHILIFRVSSAISLSLNLVPLFLAGWMAKKGPSTESGDEDHDDEIVEPRDSYRILGLSIAAYLSNFSLTVTAISFAMLFRVGYVWFFFMLVVLILPYCYIIKDGLKNGITWGLAQYEDHRSDMDFFFGLCFEITQTNFTALSATLFGYLKSGQCLDVKFRAPEIILLVAIVTGLFVMTMCTVPPAAGLPGYRDSFVRRIMKLTIYGLLVLTSIGLFLAVLKICGPYVCLSIIIVVVDAVVYLFNDFQQSTIVACYNGLARCVQQNGTHGPVELQALAASIEAGNTSQRSMEFPPARTRHNPETSQSAPPRAADEQSLLLVSFYSVMSGALMVSYSFNIREKRRGYSASLVTMYSAIVAYLGMVIITREATKGKTVGVWVSSIIAALLLIAALVCVIVFVLSNPIDIGTSP